MPAGAVNIFQLTRSRGAWLNFLTMKCISPKFQLTRSRGAWREDFDFTLNKLNFNSHAHVERDDARPTIWQLTRNFNSHAHVERDRVINSSNSIYLISTHTLTWSVTCNSRICITYHAFQLTRSRGAWLRSDFYKDDIFDFNSHAHVERDYSLHRFNTLLY